MPTKRLLAALGLVEPDAAAPEAPGPVETVVVALPLGRDVLLDPLPLSPAELLEEVE